MNSKERRYTPCGGEEGLQCSHIIIGLIALIYVKVMRAILAPLSTTTDPPRTPSGKHCWLCNHIFSDDQIVNWSLKNKITQM